jgi:tetratricopeptide (TPR) repeat protein
MTHIRRSETFGRLLSGAINSIATYEGKTAPVIEEELGQQLGVAGKTVQRYKAGHIPPEPTAVTFLAEAAVRRAYLGREWLERFLHAARYPFAEQLVASLCPAPLLRPRPQHIYENLPAPTYAQFVMRPQAFADVIEGLEQRTSAVLIVGLGGNGKTSLAREVAARSLREDGEVPRFDAAVWVSDKDRPGTTNLSVVLDEIARTLDYPGLAQLPHDQKQREVDLLLRRTRALVVVDNFETITDQALLHWLLRLPEPSKALVTSREKHRGMWGCWLVELRGMEDDEALALVDQRLRTLRLDIQPHDRAALDPLVAVTGGNPKALAVSLGLIKHERRTIQQVVDDLHAARGDLFEDLFARAWALLDEAARRLLMVLTFFPASAVEAAVGAVADVRGFALTRSLERLSDLALVDVQQSGLTVEARYLLHPLVRAFAEARLAEHSGLAPEARTRWVAWYGELAATYKGEGWRLAGQFDRAEAEIPTLEAVLRFCADTRRWRELIDIVAAVKSYWSTRGLYQTRATFLELAIGAAEQLGNREEQVALVSYQIRTLCYLGEITAAQQALAQAHRLLATITSPRPGLIENLNEAHIRLCYREGNLEQQLALARANVASSRERDTPVEILYRYYIAEAHVLAGDDATAEPMFLQLIAESEQEQFHRATITGWLNLAQIALRRGDLDEAESRLGRGWALAEALKHFRLMAEIHQTWADVYQARGLPDQARAALEAAEDLFRRLGMRLELAAVRAALQALP